MKTLDQVDAQIAEWKRQGLSKAEIVRKTADLCYGWPYVFGARGEKCTPDGRKSYDYGTHPAIIENCQVLSGKSASCNTCPWGIGVRMYDCRGFTYWLLRQVDITIKGAGATSQWDDDSNWSEKGIIADMPRDKVCCVFKRKDKKMSHTGMYVLGGKIVHCSGTVKVGSINDSGWTHYGVPFGLYGGDPMPDVRPTLRRGDSGEWVKIMQNDLSKAAYTLDADGKFGAATEKALRQFQMDNGLTVDGVCGQKTWAVLETYEEQPVPPEPCDTVTVKRDELAAQRKKLEEVCGWINRQLEGEQ